MPELNPYQLSHIAGCMNPDSLESVGAHFLSRIYDAVNEFIDDLQPINDNGDPDVYDRVSEIVDSAIPVGTHELWKTCVDLGAYDEDLDELGYEYDKNQTYRFAQTGLYILGTRLGNLLVERYRPITCVHCDGSGEIEGIGSRVMVCETCNGSGKISPTANDNAAGP